MKKNLILFLLIALAVSVIGLQWIKIEELKKLGGRLCYFQRSVSHSGYGNADLAKLYYEFNTKRLTFNGSPVFIAPCLDGHVIITDFRGLGGRDPKEKIDDAKYRKLTDFVDKELGLK